MTALVKISDVYVTVKDIYVKRSGVWTKAVEGYTRIDGAWVLFHENLPAPPLPPVISLENDRVSGGRRSLKVGARYPLASHYSKLRNIRVLIAASAYPPAYTSTTGYYSTPDVPSYPGEAFSNWRFNRESPDQFDHEDSSIWHYKHWTPKITTNSDTLPGNKTYYVSAWSEDLYGQVSQSTNRTITTPAGSDNDTNIYRAATFLPVTTGYTFQDSDDLGDETFTEGLLQTDWAIGESVTKKFGSWHYGIQLNENLAGDITKATIRMTRPTTSIGSATEEIHLGWHEVGTAGGEVFSTMHGNQLLGSMSKGQTKVWDVPDAYLDELKGGAGLRGLLTRPDASGNTYDIKGNDTELRSGELTVNWRI